MEPSLVSAISKGLFKQVRYLIEYGRSVNQRDADGRTPAMLCAMVTPKPWAVSLLRLLIEKGADLARRDHAGLTALHYACMYGNLELVRVLLEALDFDLNAADIHGNTALHYAVTLGHVVITKLLVQTTLQYKLSIDKQNNIGVTPLIQAWKSKQVQCARILIDDGKANEDIRDMVDFRTAKDWEDLCMCHIRLKEAFVCEDGDRRYARRHRARSAMKENRPAFAGSDRLLSRRRPLTTVTLTPQGDVSLSLDETIQDAGPNALRNDIERIFKTDSITMFGNNRRCSIESDSKSSSVSDSDVSMSLSWRRNIRKLYSTMEYMCSPSFRPPAKPESRPPSPPSSELSDNVSDITTLSKRTQRKISSGRQSADSTGRRSRLGLQSAQGKQRRISASNMQNLKTQSNSLDCSSNESLNIRADKKQTASGNTSKAGSINSDSSSSSRGRDQRILTPHPQKERPESATDKHHSLHAIRE